MFDKIKNLFAKQETSKRPEPTITIEPKLTVQSKPKAPRKPRVKKIVEEIKADPTEKELATAAGKPYIAILRVEVDPKNINAGAFELDWNVPFLKKLIRAGYHQKDSDTDEVVVDRWFQTVCRNIALEHYEQQQADPLNRGDADVRPPLAKRNLGDGKVEIS